MGGGGAIQAMINSIKANARPKRKYFKRPKEKAEIEALKSAIKEKSISEAKLESVKEEIRATARYERRARNIKVYLIILIVSIPVLFYSYKSYQTIQDKNRISKGYYSKQQIKHKELVSEGYNLLKLGKLSAAKDKFLEANKINSNDYVLQLGLAKVYIKICIYARRDCWQANWKLEQLLQKYGQTNEILKIKNEYDKYAPKNY